MVGDPLLKYMWSSCTSSMAKTTTRGLMRARDMRFHLGLSKHWFWLCIFISFHFQMSEMDQEDDLGEVSIYGCYVDQ